MTEIGVHEAKTRLSALLRDVEAGDEVVVTRGGKAVARIIPVAGSRASIPTSRFGLLASEFGDTGDWEDEDDEAIGDLFGLPAGAG